MGGIGVLVIPAGGAGIGIIESLHSSSLAPQLRVFAADTDPYCGALHMGMATPLRVPTRASTNDFVSAIFMIVERYAIQAILAGNEPESLILAEYRDALKIRGCTFLSPGLQNITTAANKYQAMQMAQRIGIPCPRTIRLATPGDIDAIDLKYPIVLKPGSGIGGGARGVRFASNPSEARAHFLRLSAEYSDVLAQEEIPGGAGSIHMVPLLYDAGGRLVAAFCSRSLKTVYSWGGYALAGESVHNPTLIGLATRLMEAFKPWSGPASVEFKVDSRDGTPYLLEINTRINGYNYLAHASGVNFAELAVRASLGETISEHRVYTVGMAIVRTFRTVVLSSQEYEDRMCQWTAVAESKG